MTTIEAKKLALFYYGDLFDEYYNFIQIDNNSVENYNGIKEAIDDLYFQKYQDMYQSYPVYTYVSRLLEQSFNTNYTDPKVLMITSVYEKLIERIAKFSFKVDHEGSTGDKENKNTDKILYQLSLIKDYIFRKLQAIDNTLQEDLPHNDRVFIENRLKEMLYVLLSSLNDLIYRQDEYNQAMKVVKGIDVPRFDDVNIIDTLNEQLKNWKVSRNGTLNNITKFINKLDELVSVMYSNNNSYICDRASSRYEHAQWNNYIEHSDNAYCYKAPYSR